MVYASGMKRLTSSTVIVTPEGNILAEAGELTDADVHGIEIESMRQLHGAPRPEKPLWKAGRPIEIVVKGEKTVISRGFLREETWSGDFALPPEVLKQRKKLINDRMKQERV